MTEERELDNEMLSPTTIGKLIFFLHVSLQPLTTISPIRSPERRRLWPPIDDLWTRSVGSPCIQSMLNPVQSNPLGLGGNCTRVGEIVRCRLYTSGDQTA